MLNVAPVSKNLSYSHSYGFMSFVLLFFIVTGSEDSCTNLQPDYNCNYWQKQGFCSSSHVKYMKKHCKKACGLC